MSEKRDNEFQGMVGPQWGCNPLGDALTSSECQYATVVFPKSARYVWSLRELVLLGRFPGRYASSLTSHVVWKDLEGSTGRIAPLVKKIAEVEGEFR